MTSHKTTTLAALVAIAWSLPAMALDLDLYADVLSRHTAAVEDAAGTRIDYAALRGDPTWRQLVATLEASDPSQLTDRNEKLAFWINAYNVLAIDWVVREGPVDSIRDFGNLFRPVWKKKAGRIGDRDVTLDGIEHQTLRPMGEPRIHFAIVCASTSCPSLRREPFRAGTLDRQLDEQAGSFLADSRKGLTIDRGKEAVRISSIFRWFAEDFARDGGTVAFLAKHGPDADRPWLAKHLDEIDVGYLSYDWNVNALPGRK